MSTANVRELREYTDSTHNQIAINAFVAAFSQETKETLKQYIRETAGETKVKVVIEPGTYSYAYRDIIMEAVEQYNSRSTTGVPLVFAEEYDSYLYNYYDGHGPQSIVFFDWRGGNKRVKYDGVTYAKVC